MMSVGSQTRAATSWTAGSLSRDALLDIVARGSSLAERLQLRVPGPSADEDSAAAAHIERWCQLVAEGDGEVLRKRLAWDGVDLEVARDAIGCRPWPIDRPLPAWAETVSTVLEIAASLVTETGGGGLRVESCFRSDHSLPFQDVLLPFVLVARTRLAERAGPSLDLLSGDALATLEHRLLQRLTWLCANPLLVEFGTRRQARQSSFTRLVAALQGGVGRDQYVAFTRAMLGGGLADLLLAYPVLARLAATVTELWTDAVGEFVLRLEADLGQIQATFHPSIALGQVVAVGPAVSDAHNGGRSVLAITFASGLRLVYKPKNIHLEEAYFTLLGWLEARGAPLTFRQLRVLPRQDYGWAELAETLPCEDAEAARRYYQRAGMLLCLLYGLAGNDCHYDNLVAHGEHPVLVDMETFMHPQPQPFEDDAASELLGARATASEVFRASVLSTGLLPQWLVSSEGRTHDASGLGGVGEQVSFDPMPRWVHVNTNAMALTQEYATLTPTQNVAVLDGQRLSPNEYVDEIVDGLRGMYALLMRHRDELLAEDGPLSTFAHQPVRFMLRDTRAYALVIERALQRRYLRDGAAFSIELDVLSRALVTTTTPNVYWPLRGSEQAAMERLDIPFFGGRADRDDLVLPDGVTVEGAFTRPSFEVATERLRQLSADDLERQVAYTRASLFSRTASSRDETGSTKPDGPRLDATPLNPDELVGRAAAIARELAEQAIRSPDGGTTWIGVAYLPQADRYQLEPTGYDLYSGNPGVALLLAALAAVTGSTAARDDARSAMLQVSQALRAHPERLAKGLGIGGADGTGSLVYALTRAGKLLEDPDLVGDAERAAALVTPERIAADRGLDIVTGSAGALLSLLALHDLAGEAGVLDRATLCGRRLLETQVSDGPERGSWPTLGQTGLTGFSHGAAGIAYALLRLAERTGDPELRAAADEAVGYESRVFAPDEGNWPDLRKDVVALTGRHSFMTSWCHGATGIGLARFSGLAGLDTPQVREDIDVAVEATRRFGAQGVDHVCCGTMGRAELLLTVGRGLERPELVDAAGRLAATVVREADEADGFHVVGRLPRGVSCPSFFQGTAGIGYQLLRLAYPDQVPSVLVWG